MCRQLELVELEIFGGKVAASIKFQIDLVGQLCVYDILFGDLDLRLLVLQIAVCLANLIFYLLFFLARGQLACLYPGIAGSNAVLPSSPIEEGNIEGEGNQSICIGGCVDVTKVFVGAGKAKGNID